MTTTVLVENAVTLVAVGLALHRTRKLVLLTVLFAVQVHMGADNLLMHLYNPTLSRENHTIYYWFLSFFFLVLSGMFMVRPTRLSILIAGCVLIQAIISFVMAMNGAVINNLVFPEFSFIYGLHELINDILYVIEWIIVYVAATTGRR